MGEQCSCCCNGGRAVRSPAVRGAGRFSAPIVKGTGTAIFIAALALDRAGALTGWAGLAPFAAAYLLIGGGVAWRALKNISRGKVFDENFLMTLATVGAFAVGEYPEAVAVMLFYQVGEAFQEYAVGKSRKSISALMDIRPDYADVKKDGRIVRVSPEDVAVGSLVVVKPGEKVPLDGIVAEGVSAFDTSMLTGESLPRDAAPGTAAFSGFINKTGLLVIETTKPASESTAAKILDMVENAGSKKTPVENFITKFARWYTPCVVFAAAALAVVPPLALPGAAFSEWIHRALVFLVVSCPCALVISIPLGFFAGIGCASKNGVLVKGSNYLDALTGIDTVVFDKTGTLTRGMFSVTGIFGEEPFGETGVLEYAALAELFSTHPIAVSIRNEYEKRTGGKTDESRVSGFEDVQGKGVRAVVDGKRILAGKARFLEESGISHNEIRNEGVGGLRVCVSVNGEYAGSLVIADEVKPDSRDAIAALKKLGVKRTAMISGDTKAVAEPLGASLGIDAVFAEQLPHEKVERVEELERAKTTGGRLVFVGDGINDAPVLARSDVGVAMGGLGSDAAIEAADIVLMTDEPSKLADAVRIARKTRSVVRQNIAFALAVKAALLLMGALGAATLWEAVFGDVGVAVLAVLNSMRALKYRAGRMPR